LEAGDDHEVAACGADVLRRIPLLLAPFALAACGGGGAGTPVNGDPLGVAVRNTLAQGSEKVTLKGTVDLSGQKVSIDGDGAFNRSGGTLHLHLDLPTVGTTTVDELVVGKAIWIHSSLLAASLHGKHWLRIKGSTALGFNVGVFAGVTPTTALSVLQQHGKLTALGTDTLNGVSTTHYHVVLGMTNQNTRYNSADAWVDGQNLIRRVKLDFSANIASTGGTNADTVVTIDYSDFGTAVTVTAPAPSDVSG
jgi:hypothetical protein